MKKALFALFALFLLGISFAQAGIQRDDEGTIVNVGEGVPIPKNENIKVIETPETQTVETTSETTVDTTQEAAGETSEAGSTGGPSEGLRSNVMMMQSNKVSCRLDFYRSILTNLGEESEKLGKSTDVESVIASINENEELLSQAAETGDRQAYNDATKSLIGDIKDLVRKYHELKTEIKEEASDAQSTSSDVVVIGAAGTEENEQVLEILRQQRADATAKREEALGRLQAAFLDEKRELNACLQESSRKLGEAQAAYVRAWYEKAKETTASLKQKTVDTSEMEAVLTEVNAVVAQAEDIGSSQDPAEQVELIKSKHNYLWAKFQLVRIEALLKKLEPYAEKRGLDNELHELLEETENAQTVLGKTYDQAEFDLTRTKIKELVGELRELFKKIKEG